MKKESAAARLRQSAIIPVLCALLWCFAIYILFRQMTNSKTEQAERLALTQTRTLHERILDARAWNSAHGGVYVPESRLGAPNPYLPEEQRLLISVDGRRLVLMNPAYMSRQIADISAGKGAEFRITSHNPLRPENRSDPWETAALAKCMTGRADEVFSLEYDSGRPYYRYMAPLHTEADCLLCHKSNKEGDVRGGISVKLDARPFLSESEKYKTSIGLTFAFVGLTGALGIGGIGLAVRRKRFLAEEADRIKSRFLANMSHDMRTPLSGIMGLSELLAGAESKEDRMIIAGHLQMAGNALLEMVTDLTDHALIDADRLKLDSKEFCPREAAGKCLDLVRPACEIKNLKLSLIIAEDVPEKLLGDEFRLRQALGNLLGNAVKFTLKGSVSLAVGAERADSNKMRLNFAVADTGPGLDMSGNEPDRIFERFERGGAAKELKASGTGLGLSIAREIARKMGGDVSVSGNPGGGAVFVLSAVFDQTGHDGPSCGASEARPEKNVTESSLAAGRTSFAPHEPLPVNGAKRVLIVEDNAVNAYFMSETLKAAGHRPLVAADGEQALALLRTEKHDAVFMDLRLPDPDGFAIAARIRTGQTAAPADTPVFAFSASLSAEDHIRLDRLKVPDRLLKPVPGHVLLSLLDGVDFAFKPSGFDPDPACSPPRPRIAQVPADKKSEAPVAGALPVYDHNEALRHMDGCEEILKKLGSIFCAELPEQLDALRAAESEENRREVHRLAHALKNSAYTLSFARLGRFCASLEKNASQGESIKNFTPGLAEESRLALKAWKERHG